MEASETSWKPVEEKSVKLISEDRNTHELTAASASGYEAGCSRVHAAGRSEALRIEHIVKGVMRKV
jgi:hypothetical protein